jgi:ABC-type proline/glycine betaine transport system ATPase subunit
MKKAVIFVTHDLREALLLADESLMEDGRLIVNLPASFRTRRPAGKGPGSLFWIHRTEVMVMNFGISLRIVSRS